VRKHWKRWAALLTLVVLAGVLALPSVHWPLYGWLRGEAFYQGWPTSWWDREIARLEVYYMIRHGSLDTPYALGYLSRGFRLLSAPAGPPSNALEWWELCKDKLGLGRNPGVAEWPAWQVLLGCSPGEIPQWTPDHPFGQIDPATLPVKRELTRSSRPFVRQLAVRYLKFHLFEVMTKPQDQDDSFQADLQLVKSALADEALDVRLEAALAMIVLGALDGDPADQARLQEEWLRKETSLLVATYMQPQPFAAVACLSHYLGATLPLPESLVDIFIQGLKHESMSVRSRCATELGNGGVSAQRAVPALLELLVNASRRTEKAVNENDPHIHLLAVDFDATVEALKKIDPTAARRAGVE